MDHPAARSLELFVLYRLLHWINEWFALTVLGLYILAFAVGCAFIFVFPLVPLVLVFCGVAGLGVAALSGRALHALENLVARQLLGGGICPKCRHRNAVALDRSAVWSCDACGTTFEPSGAQLQTART